MPPELLRQVRLIEPNEAVDRIVDVLVGADAVLAIANQLETIPDSTQIRDGEGLVLAPGLVDLYSHTGEPGFESRETLADLVLGAQAGGFTRLGLLPDTDPVCDSPDQVAGIQQRLPTPCPVQVYSWGALTQGIGGQQLVDLAELAKTSIVGFSDGRPLNQLVLLRRLLEYLAPFQLPIALWPCQIDLAGDGVAREGIQSLQAGLPENPTLSETTALAALLELLAHIPTPVHLMRISTARSVELVRQAKARGLQITASVSWMHLIWNSAKLATYDPNFRLDPPLGNPRDQQALLAGLEDGTLDAIALDHQAYTFEEKAVSFAEAPPGVIGLELALPILWQTFVATQRWHPLDLWRYLSHQPALCLNQPPPQVRVGHPPEMLLFDPNQTWTVTAATLKSPGLNTPWLNHTLMGRVLQTWCPK
ncbi:dihydroorotase [Synechococcales cyanobacterium C]|uniref:Dihydroorotase n=1 Tax=Petrachloros mirabilis ULC683 TaxID=2781853 RepID=A0A8K2A6Q0_9CYAN|nr:dihydroorotase [Petrachloros mirabilis]NCJ05330.1 dihydroorotase [Petrachloros mirabilis ULC683]